jgi:predicted transcriptional regulator
MELRMMQTSVPREIGNSPLPPFFFDDIQVIKRVRASDPVTSVEAAERAAKFATSHAGRILSALRLHGALTAHEIGTRTGLTVVQVDRRLPELKESGCVAVQQDGDGDLVRDGFRVWCVRP